MTKRYELRKVWGFGPITRRTVVSTFESAYVAEHVMDAKIRTAKKKGRKLILELVDLTSDKIVRERASR